MDEKTKSRLGALQRGKELLLLKYDVNKINKFCRTVYPFTAEQMEVQGIKLNIGCYWMRIDGLTNIDIKTDVGADQVFNVKDILQFYKPGSVNLILLSHCLEHLTFEEGKKVLKDIFQVLNFGGQFIVEVPDCSSALEEALKKGKLSEHDYQQAKKGMPQEFGQKHECEYTEEILVDFLIEVGFKHIERNLVGSIEQPVVRLDIVKE